MIPSLPMLQCLSVRILSNLRDLLFDPFSFNQPLQPAPAGAFEKLRAGCPKNRQAGSLPYVACQTSLPGANILHLVSRQKSSAVGRAFCLPVAAASSRKLMFGRILFRTGG